MFILYFSVEHVDKFKMQKFLLEVPPETSQECMHLLQLVTNDIKSKTTSYSVTTCL